MSLKTSIAVACAASLAIAGLAAGGFAGPSAKAAELPTSQVLAAGDQHTVAIDADGHLWAWGSREDGRLGDGIDIGRTATPVQVPGLSHVVSVGAAYGHTVAALADGTVWTWGSNWGSALGTGVSDSYSAVPVQVPELTDVTLVTAGGSSSWALTRSGLVYGWGHNRSYRLGNGDDIDSATPVLVAGVRDVVDVVAGSSHTVALTASGEVWTWGGNYDGQLGTGSDETVLTPVRVDGVPPMTAVAAGSTFTLAVDATGRVWGWGDASGSGLLGLGTKEGSLEPVPIPGLVNVASIAASQFVIAITLAGDVWTWGGNYTGQLGSGDLTSTWSPAHLDLPEPASRAAVSMSHTAVLGESGELYSWGDNTYFQLGDESSIVHPYPTPVRGMTDVVGVGADIVNTVVLRRNGEVWAWGGNDYGQLGNGTAIGSVAPVQVRGLDGLTVTMVDTGYGHMVALTDTGEVWAWGQNVDGQLGIGLTEDKYSPVRVDDAPPDVVYVIATTDYSAALTESGEVWTWGQDWDNQLGHGTGGGFSFTDHPVKVNDLPPVAALAAGSGHMMAVTAQGELWAWGDNYRGQLGIGGDSLSEPLPVRVPLTGKVESVACGNYHTLVTMETGDVLAWGDNYYGSLGNGSTTRSFVPVAVQGVRGPGRLYAGNGTSMLLTDDGDLYAWGWNDFAQAGIGTQSANVSIPALVAGPGVTLASTATEHAALVYGEDGNAYTWGGNSYAPLGYPSPPWTVAARVTGLNLGGFRPPTGGPSPSEDPGPPPSQSPGPGDDDGKDPQATPEPSEDPDTDPSPQPSGGSTSGLGSRPTSGADEEGLDQEVDLDLDLSRRLAQPAGAQNNQPAGSSAGVHDAGRGALPGGAGGSETATRKLGGPAISRFAASFTTVVIQAGQSVKVPVASFRHSATAPGKARVTWASLSPGTATVTAGKKAGAWTWSVGQVKNVAIRGLKLGTARIVISSPGAKALVLRVRVVPRHKAHPISRIIVRTVGGAAVPTRVTLGDSVWLKARPNPISAARVEASWTSTNPAVVWVSPVGRVLGLARGKAVIVCRARGATVLVPITVA
ncbi:MAG: hypothetical protein LBK72_03305 [Bifidobacteriaceae bacterium]|jgi:alpha-tubulin suppressor-like RCC1 family protein|nr:hypothetical protein [Bifidobacteriaceae bacterium]